MDTVLMQQIYDRNKAAYVGEICVCPSCATEFEKTNYQQAFCKSKEGTACKDFYWNNLTPDKKNNTQRLKGLAWTTTNKNEVATHSMGF